MAYARNFIQLTWGGSYFTEDIWINGVHLIDVGPDGTNSLPSAYSEYTLAELAGHIQGLHTDQYGNSEHARLDWAKMALVGVDGKYVTDPIVHDFLNVPGGRAGNMYPQLATAVTLRNSKKRGPSAVGRFYAPAALPIDATGRVVRNDQIVFAGKVETMIGGINGRLAFIAGVPNVVVGNVSKVGLGSQEPVTRISVGDITDTQRRRRNKMREHYEEVPVSS